MSTFLPLGKPGPSGTIPICPHKSCAYRCCDFQQAGSILLYPGEVENAQADGHSLDHLQVLDSSYYGGVEVKCRAKNTATCDNGYKPLDCASYPLFPLPSYGSAEGSSISRLMITKASGCPIQGHEITGHRAYVQDLWQRIIAAQPEVEAWLSLVWLDLNAQTDPEHFDLI